MQRNKLQIEHILKIKQLADIFIKQLPINQYRTHCITIGLDVRIAL